MQNTAGDTSHAYTYDPNADVIASVPKSITNISYDAETRMTPQITMNSGEQLDFEYTANKERLIKADVLSGIKSSVLYLNGLSTNPLTQKFDSKGNIPDNCYIYGPHGLVAMEVGSTTYFVLKDHLGSTRAVVASSVASSGNTISSTYDYTPFGSLWRSGINTDLAYRFTGQEYDLQEGLSNFHARLYDADLARFYSPDAAGQSFSNFSYAGDNPVMFVDANGMWFGLDDLIVAFVGFVEGYVSTGLKTHHWGSEALANGLIDAVAADVSYNVGPEVAGELFAKGSAGYALTENAVGGAVGSMTSDVGDQLYYNHSLNLAETASAGVGGFGGGLAEGAYDISGASNLFSNWYFHHTIDHVLGATAFEMGQNLISGASPFERLDYGLNSGAVIPVAEDLFYLGYQNSDARKTLMNRINESGDLPSGITLRSLDNVDMNLDEMGATEDGRPEWFPITASTVTVSVDSYFSYDGLPIHGYGEAGTPGGFNFYLGLFPTSLRSWPTAHYDHGFWLDFLNHH